MVVLMVEKMARFGGGEEEAADSWFYWYSYDAFYTHLTFFVES